MRFVFTDSASSREVLAVAHDPDATVAHLVRALDPTAPPEAGLLIDGARIPGARRLDRAGLFDGTTVSIGDGGVDRTPPRRGRVVAVTGGLHAGDRVDLVGTEVVVGRDPGPRPRLCIDDPTVSRRQALVASASDAVRVTDLGSHNGTWVDGSASRGPTPVPEGAVLRVGATQLHVRPEPPLDRVAAPNGRLVTGSTVPFNRPPRTLTAATSDTIAVPVAPDDPAPSPTIGVVAIAVPMVMALAMMKLFSNPAYGLFALLGPMLLVGGAVEGRRRRTRTGHRREQRFRADLEQFADRLAAAGEEEARRLDVTLPDPAEVVRRADAPSTRLWERRPHHDDFLCLRAGTGPVRLTPPLDHDAGLLPERISAVLAGAAERADTPVGVELSGGAVIGVAGPRHAALAVARSLLLQVAIHQGPADVAAAVLTTPEHRHHWAWASWLPHTADRERAGRPLVLTTAAEVDELLGPLVGRADGDPGPVLLLVIDSVPLLATGRSLARSALRGAAGPTVALVMAPSPDLLPATCTAVVELTDGLGTCHVHHPATGATSGPGLAAGVGEATALRAARALARFADPELAARAGAGLPPATTLLDAAGLGELDAAGLARGWDAAGTDPPLVVPLGVGTDGTVSIDLVADGPHALVAGTTGSGKSELLRTLVAGLTLAAPPEHLAFVLVDFKGGSAFDRCAELPHTVGVVTDLDDALASRALRSLEAELRHRERLLRRAGAEDLTAYRAASPAVPVPRLVVVIDEFATLVAEVPDFVDRLVSVAQRGRSLGVHLVLATQRPAGAVSDHIRANTNLRIALRIQDPSESTDVVGVPDAASLPRRQPGRALARLGHGEVVAFQTALVTCASRRGGRSPVEVRWTGGNDGEPADPQGEPSRPSDLARLVDAAGQAFARSGAEPPRPPWVPPLPDRIDLEACAAGPADGRFHEPRRSVDFYVVDDPDHQRQEPGGWAPGDGNLLLVGIAGSGTTTALASVALAATSAAPPDELHLYVVDHGAGELAPLADLPHTGAHVSAGEPERQERLVRFLRAELSGRAAVRRSSATGPRLLVLIDNFAGLRHAWPEAGAVPLVEELTRILVDGPEVGIHAAVATDRAAALPPALLASLHQKLLFRPADPGDHASFGVPAAALPTYSPGTAVRAHDRLTVQVGIPAAGLAAEVAVRAARLAPCARPPKPIGRLPSQVPVASIVRSAAVSAAPWFLPLGIGEGDLLPAGLRLHDGDHALVAGPPRSGRTTALVILAAVAVAHGVPVIAVADARRSALAATPGVRLLEPESLADAAPTGPLLVLVDDAELVTHPALAALVGERRPGLHLVAAGRADALRHGYDHWTRAVRAARVGLLLDPDPDLDGDLLGTRLPRLAPVAFTVGRGWLLGPAPPEVVQLAGPVAVD